MHIYKVKIPRRVAKRYLPRLQQNSEKCCSHQILHTVGIIFHIFYDVPR